MGPFEIAQVYAQTPGYEAPVIVDGAGMYGYAAVWAIAIIGVVELVKRLWIAKFGVKSESFQRVVALLPVVVGMLTAPVFGPPTLRAFALEFTPLETVWFGPGAGAAAGWVFALVKHTIAPMLPAAAREAFRALARRAGLSLKDEARHEP